MNPYFSDFGYWKNDFSTVAIEIPENAAKTIQEITPGFETAKQHLEHDDIEYDSSDEKPSIGSLELAEHLREVRKASY